MFALLHVILKIIIIIISGTIAKTCVSGL